MRPKIKVYFLLVPVGKTDEIGNNKMKRRKKNKKC